LFFHSLYDETKTGYHPCVPKVPTPWSLLTISVVPILSRIFEEIYHSFFHLSSSPSTTDQG